MPAVFGAGAPQKPRCRPSTCAMALSLLLCLMICCRHATSGTLPGNLPQPDTWVSMATYKDVLSTMERSRQERLSAPFPSGHAADLQQDGAGSEHLPVVGYVDPVAGPGSGSAPVMSAASAPAPASAAESASDSESDILSRLRRACESRDHMACVESEVIQHVDRTLKGGSYKLTSVISLEPDANRSARTVCTNAATAAPGERSLDTSSQKTRVRNLNQAGSLACSSSSSGRSRRSSGLRSGSGSLEPATAGPVGPEEVADHILDRMDEFARSHMVQIKLNRVARDIKEQPKLFGKNSFLTGFGLGFLAFGLKKLLLPFFIGAQIVKSILIAMFLPSILGSVGKLVGKGVTTFATSSAQNGGFSGSSSGGNALGGGGGDDMENFDFKDNGAANQYPDAASSGSELMPSYATLAAPPGFGALQTLPGGGGGGGDSQPLGTLPAMFQAAASAASNVLANKYQPKTSYAHKHQVTSNSLTDHGGSFYNRHKPHDFKTFQNIPSSSMLLTHYDPFYSPLLSRLDSVFHQLGYTSESCRERLVCAMYRNPAKFAPFSNLVSAQLSRELNELRKPSSDNPEILRFFRYMKAAKDGQDNRDCNVVYAACTLSDAGAASPMAYTFQDINKLVQARRLSRMLGLERERSEPAAAPGPGPVPVPAAETDATQEHNSRPAPGLARVETSKPIESPAPASVPAATAAA